jgi:hypothetical protein
MNSPTTARSAVRRSRKLHTRISKPVASRRARAARRRPSRSQIARQRAGLLTLAWRDRDALASSLRLLLAKTSSYSLRIRSPQYPYPLWRDNGVACNTARINRLLIVGDTINLRVKSHADLIHSCFFGHALPPSVRLSQTDASPYKHRIIDAPGGPLDALAGCRAEVLRNGIASVAPVSGRWRVGLADCQEPRQSAWSR